MPIEQHAGGTTITGDGIEKVRLLSLQMAFKVEARGMKLSRGISAIAIARKQYGLKGNRESLARQVDELIAAWNRNHQGPNQTLSPDIQA